MQEEEEAASTKISALNSMEVEEEETVYRSTPNGLLPTVGKYIKEFESFISWVGVKGQEKPVPRQGLVPSYDLATKAVRVIEDKLQKYLEEIQILMKDKTIKYGLRYEIEVHEDLLKGNKKPVHFDFTSKAGKYQRF